jgi:hypothetical protein
MNGEGFNIHKFGLVEGWTINEEFAVVEGVFEE